MFRVMTLILGGFLVGFGSTPLVAETGSSRSDFQLSEPLQSRAEFFSSRDRRLVFRLFTEVDIDSLRRQQSGDGDGAYSVELVVGSNGAIEEFAINRFNQTSVFQVDLESERLRFLRLRDASSVFRDLGLISDSIDTTADFVFEYVTRPDDERIRMRNLQVLHAIRIFEPLIAELRRKIDSARAESGVADDTRKAQRRAAQIDHLKFLEDLNQDVESRADQDTEAPVNTADSEKNRQL